MTSIPDERSVIQGVDWAFYEQLVDSIPGGANIHVDYDGKDLEIMSISILHDDGRSDCLGRVVEIVAEECEIPFKSAGQSTWKRPEIARGLESDQCFFFRAEKLVVAAKSRAAEVQQYRRLSQSGSRNRSRHLSLENRPAGDLCRARRDETLAI